MTNPASLAGPPIATAVHRPMADEDYDRQHHHDDHRDHHHGHSHLHIGSGEGRPRGGPVLLDIGGDVGAAIVRLDDALDGTELPILAIDDPNWDRTTHTGVWRRSIGAESVVVAVYPSLPSGRYRITVPARQPIDLLISGGQVTNVDLRSAAGAAESGNTIAAGAGS